jgi:hypothetical protein
MRTPRPRHARRRTALATTCASLFAAVALTAQGLPAALADEPRSATEPRVMEEPGEVVNVIDSFEDADPFDLNVSLGFEYATKSAKILRETHIFQPGLTTGGYTSNLMNVAAYSESTSRLVPRVDVGLYKDIALYFELPIILSSSRKLDDLDGSSQNLAVVAAGAPGETLFSVPFTSPDRSGLENIAVGVQANILNQARDRSKPTWLLGFEARFSVGTPMHACNPSPKPGQVSCADPSDVNRDGSSNGYACVGAKGGSQRDCEAAGGSWELMEGRETAEREPGVTRGTIALSGRTLLSKRMKYLEPYGGFEATIELPQGSSDYGVTDLQASLVNHPPLVGGMILGVMIIPWENREKHGRLTFDLRLDGQYRSEGRDYSELFDALGSSDAPSLRNPQWARFEHNPDFESAPCSGDPKCRSVVDTGSQKTYFTGLTDVAAHGSYRVSTSVLWQASEFVKFQLGFGFRHDQGHGISGDQPCNPDFKDDIDRAGNCTKNDSSSRTATGVPNPNYRATVNAAGRRFFVDDSNTFDVFASGTVMF